MEKLRELIRKEIKNVLNENMQSKLIDLFKKKPKDKELIIFLRHSGKYRDLELNINDLKQITTNKYYGFGTNQDGDEVEFKFSDVTNYILI